MTRRCTHATGGAVPPVLRGFHVHRRTARPPPGKMALGPEAKVLRSQIKQCIPFSAKNIMNTNYYCLNVYLPVSLSLSLSLSLSFSLLLNCPLLPSFRPCFLPSFPPLSFIICFVGSVFSSVCVVFACCVSVLCMSLLTRLLNYVCIHLANH